ncbi:MAG: hypothetical protein HKO56_00515 [Bacteroidia bacterium]|nr:hypothetical protein [Bacteroidia bacterium]NNC85559.1 hypothetical protein [Bacteroidia bacterium]NNM15107.1 hypothetical protein [Bacteroidia bacterium]
MKQRIKAIIIAIIVFVLVINLVGYLIKAPEISNLSNGQVELVGHAGSGFNYLISPWNPLPSNSLASINKALINGAAGIEVDVHVSKDSVLILFHDLTLNAKTNLTGNVATHTSTVLTKTNYILGFPYDFFQNEKIISLSELIGQHKNKNYTLYLDIKYDEENEDSDINLFKSTMSKFLKSEESQSLDITIISSSSELIRMLKPESEDVDFAFDCDEDVLDHLKIAKAIGCKSLAIKRKNATNEITGKIHKEGLEVILYGGKSKLGLRKMLELNPDVVQVNNVKAMKNMLN